MHGDLSPNLHTPECNLLIEEFNRCHAENPVAKFFGTCNKIDKLLLACLRNERKANQSENLRRSAERQKKFQERLNREKSEPNVQ
ncbi:hypothetical protein HA402_002342 [Bradysia odoriphaga]|nr:hypothetical protein HA402_002342 [Bradysia odoriphaga]